MIAKALDIQVAPSSTGAQTESFSKTIAGLYRHNSSTFVIKEKIVSLTKVQNITFVGEGQDKTTEGLCKGSDGTSI